MKTNQEVEYNKLGGSKSHVRPLFKPKSFIEPFCSGSIFLLGGQFVGFKHYIFSCLTSEALCYRSCSGTRIAGNAR